MESRSDSLPGNARKFAWKLGLAMALIYVAFLPPASYSIDGASMLAVTESIVTNHDFTVPKAFGLPGRNGRIYSPWYPLQSILAVPLVAAGTSISHILHTPPHYTASLLAGLLPAFCTAGTVAFVALLALQLGSTFRGARRAALAYGFGTVAGVYARSFFAEPLLSFIVVAGAFCVITGVARKIIMAAGLAALAVLAKSTAVLLGPILTCYLIARRKPFYISVLPIIGTGIGLLIYFVYNYARFGNPFFFGPTVSIAVSGQSHELSLSLSQIPVGLAGLLVSPGRGLLWYCPPVVLSFIALSKVSRFAILDALLLVALFLGWLFLFSSWTTWHGGGAWGPRYIVPGIPALTALVGLLEGNWAKTLVALTIVGAIVSAPTFVSYYERYYSEADEQGIPPSAIYWSPKYSPLIRVWGSAARTIRDARDHDLREVFGSPRAKKVTVANSRALRVIAIWWWILPIGHIPRWPGFLCALAMVVGGLWMLLRLKMDDPTNTDIFDARPPDVDLL